MAEQYEDVLLPFLELMRRELRANSRKGERSGWLRMDPSTALLEVYWHVAKLSAAVKNNDGPAIQEHSADVANMAMMVLDVCGGLVHVADDAAVPKRLTDESIRQQRAAIDAQTHDWQEGMGHWKCSRCGMLSQSGQELACPGGVPVAQPPADGK